MPVTQSAKRALRRAIRQAATNQKIRDAYKRAVKNVRRASTKKLSQAFSALDRAAKKGVIHHKKAARLKSRLAHLAAKNLKSKK